MSLAYVPALISPGNLPHEMITLINLSFGAKKAGKDRLFRSLAVAATESLVAAFPHIDGDVRYVARKSRHASAIASMLDEHFDDEAALVLAALFYLRRSNKGSVAQFLPSAKIGAIKSLRRLLGIDLNEASAVVDYGF